MANNRCIKELKAQSSFNSDPYSHYRVVGDEIYSVYVYNDDTICSRRWKREAIVGVQYNTNCDKHWGCFKVVYHKEGGRICEYRKEYENPIKRKCWEYKQY